MGITSILSHSPVPEGSAPVPPLENPNSLLRVLEKLLTNSPSAPKSGSGKSEGVRWACGLIKNLAKSEDNAKLFGQTEIPTCVVNNIKSTTAPPSRWTSHSLEDFSLFVILNLAQWPGSREALIASDAVEAVKPIMAEGDLQGLKATMACAFLGADWNSFPEAGAPAAKSVSELMTNIVEKKGKDGQYAYGVFKLYTATKAFRDLSLAAAAADGDSTEGVCTKCLSTPSAVALCLQIMSDLVLASNDDTEGASKYVPDAASAEYAIGAAGKIKAASGSARPILEISHDLWVQYRKREGQPLDQYLSQEKGIEVDESGPLDFLPCVSSSGESSCVIA